ncbi:MAG: LamG domain-containing protein, partial [Phycisphaeraceae bacterium]|nr:LamG domain-containing protein [Phycisphaeraceae bacterium]
MNACIQMLTRPMAVMTISLLAIILSMPQIVQAGDTTLALPAFYLPFDHSLKSNDGQEPSQERGIKYVPGVLGEAAYIGGHGRQDYAKAPLLEYDTKDLFAGESGTAMFWVSPDWDGRYDNINNIPWYTFLATMGGQSKDKVDFTTQDIKPDSQRLTVFMYNWLRTDIKQEKPAQTLSLKQGRWGWLKGDWFHVAVTWDTSGWCKLYVNGRPTSLRGKTAPGTDPQKTMVSLQDTQRMYIGSRPKTWTSSHRANAAIDEFQIFSKAISDEQVWQTYRQVMPLDIVLDQRFIRADQKQTLTLEVAPAGQLELPTSSWKTNSSINVALDVRLIRDTDNEVVAQQTHSLKVNRLQKITLPIPSIPQGNYRLTYGVKQGQYQYQKSFPIEVYTQASPLSSEDRDMTLGPAIVSIDATDPDQDFVSIGTSKIVKSAVGTYRQAGKNKMDRIAYRIDIPDEYIGLTMVVRMTWPDDQPRSIGWYMYRDMIGDKTKQHRDRLGGGTQSGDEYPLTQTM